MQFEKSFFVIIHMLKDMVANDNIIRLVRQPCIKQVYLQICFFI